VKRHPSGAVVALLLASGALASACNVTPPAATANGTDISRATLNGQLQALESTQYGGCLLQIENPQLSTTAAQGTGGSGTYTTGFAGAVLESQLGELLAEQYATSRGITVSSSDLATARSDLQSTLDGEISAAVQQSTATGTTSLCQSATGADFTGQELLDNLPSSVTDAEVRNQAFDEKLLARGADLSAAAVFDYYLANKAQFTTDCVSQIVTSSQAAANQVAAKLNAGASFADLARTSSIDVRTASNGGSLGCTYTEAGVEQALQQPTITVGRPIVPGQSSASGDWFVFEVTTQNLEPLSAASAVVRRELLQSTANVDRVSREIIAFAHRSDVTVDPQYGSWNRVNIVPPVAPPPQYLLSGPQGSAPASSLTPSGAAPGIPSGAGSTTGSGTAGSSSSSNGS